MPADFAPAAGQLCDLVAGVDEMDLGRPTPCTEYSVAALLDHIRGLTGAFQSAAVKAQGETPERGQGGNADALPSDWRSSIPSGLRELAEAWRNPQAWDGMTRIGGQETPAEVAGVFGLDELVVHGWDLARATDQQFDPDPATLEPIHEMMVATFTPENGAMRGEAFGPAVPVPSDAPILDQILGLLGRDPAWLRPA